jgi:hypothetical protein
VAEIAWATDRREAARRILRRLPPRFPAAAGRLVFSAAALALGVALVCAMDLVNRAVLRAFVEVIDTMAGRAALQVTTGREEFSEDVAANVGRVRGWNWRFPW